MVYVKAHFDGAVFVPDEPVNLPPNVPLRLTVLAESDLSAPLAALADLAKTFPPVPDWPADSAAEVDHYLYGTPKHNSKP